MSFNEWKKCRFWEIAELRKEQIKPTGKEQIYIGLEHIEQQTLRLNGVGSSNEVISNKFKFYNGDILYGKLRPYFRKVYNPKFEGVCSTDIFVIKNKKGVDKTFLFYLTATEDFTKIANSGNTGTRMPRADWNQLKESEWLLPSIETQTKIASILSSLDDKIELNRQTNQTLETIAQTLFKEICLPKSEVLPDGWQDVKLHEIIKVKHGYAFAGEFISDIETDDILVSPGNFKIGGGFNYNKFKYYNGKYPDDYILSEDDLIVTMTDLSKDGDSLGYSALVPTIKNKRLLHNQRIGKVNFKGNEIVKYFLYFTLRENTYRNFVLGSATGTTVRHTSPDRICDFSVKIPNDNLLFKFNKIVQPILLKTRQNQQEIYTLISLRDSLLQKIMKGEIEINNL